MSNQASNRIAVVDDDQAVRDSLRFLLESAGHEVDTYESGTRFLAEAEPARIACLVLDQQMPEISGLEMLARLRSRGVTTPALLIVSSSTSALAARAGELGVLGVLEKPLAADDLLARLEVAVH
jgi:two-component system response regulator FixJ